jgi:hypothetical protein
MALPKFIKKPIPSLGYSVIKHHGSTLLEGYFSCPRLFNIPVIPFIGYHINTLGSITYLLILGGVLHSFTKTYKQNNSLLRVFNKHHELSYFGLDYQKGIAYG